MSRFDDRRKRELKRNGFLVLRDAVDPDVVAACRESVLEGLPHDPDDSEALVDTPDRIENAWEHVADPEPFAELNAQVFEYTEELAGEGTLEPPGESTQIAVRFPNGDQREGDERPTPHREHGHIDGYGPAFDANHEVGYYTVMSAVYLDRVEPRGGGFTVWPGSHWDAGAYYADNHLESLVGHATLPGLDEEGGFDRFSRYDEQFDPLEIHGESGTLVLWHQNLLHCGGVNRSPNLRLSAIERFTRPDADEIKRDAYANPWKYWEGMDGVELEL